MDAADAEAVILPASAVPDEERPLLPPFLTSAHNSISPLCFLGGQHSFCFTPFAALSLSMMEHLIVGLVRMLTVFIKVIFLFGFRRPCSALVKWSHSQHDMTIFNNFYSFNFSFIHCTTTSLYTDCCGNLYAGSPSYLLILFSALSAFAVGGLSIERNQKPLAPEITLAVTHHDRQKQVEVKRSSRVNPHEIRLFSGCPYAVVK